ncbi:MAG: hypothetical protein WCJ39_01310 [bacterium]
MRTKLIGVFTFDVEETLIPVLQRDPGIASAKHDELHPSPLIALPSSHCSHHSIAPLPQICVDHELTRAIPP